MIRLSKFWFYTLVLAGSVNAVGMVYFAVEGGKYRKMASARAEYIGYLELRVASEIRNRDQWYKHWKNEAGENLDIREQLIQSTKDMVEMRKRVVDMVRSYDRDIQIALASNPKWR